MKCTTALLKFLGRQCMNVLLADACHGSYGDNCYVTVKQEKSHDDAVQWCGRIGGQLVDIQNHDENEAVKSLAAGLILFFAKK